MDGPHQVRSHSVTLLLPLADQVLGDESDVEIETRS